MKRFLLCLLALTPFVTCLALPSPVGTLQRDTIIGVPCVVYLPHNYTERVQKDNKVFPCLYLQHGMFGSENDWSQQGHLLHWLDSLLREEMIVEMVIIMPDNFLGSMPPEERQRLIEAPNVTPDGKTFSTDNGAAHWRKLTREQEQGYEMSGYWEEHFPAFMSEVEQRYSVDSNSKNRAIAGLSMGGFHTMHVSHFLVGTFDYIGLFSPVILPRVAPDLTGEMPLPDGPYRTAGFDKQVPYSSNAYNDWMNDMRQMAQMPPLYYIAIGRSDFLYVQLQDYRKWLEANSFEYTYYETDGGHTWQNWQDYLCHFLKTCFTRIW